MGRDADDWPDLRIHERARLHDADHPHVKAKALRQWPCLHHLRDLSSRQCLYLDVDRHSRVHWAS